VLLKETLFCCGWIVICFGVLSGKIYTLYTYIYTLYTYICTLYTYICTFANIHIDQFSHTCAAHHQVCQTSQYPEKEGRKHKRNQKQRATQFRRRRGRGLNLSFGLVAQHTNTHQKINIHCETLQEDAMHCTALHHAATHCSTLQHNAPENMIDN